MKLDPALIRAASTDAGNRHMRKAGRSAWNVDDYNAAVETMEQLVERAYGPGIDGWIRFHEAS